MKKRKSRKITKRKMFNKRKVILCFFIFIAIIIIINNSIKLIYQSPETLSYKQLKKIDKCIVIDAGHGGEEEPGCVFGNVYEKEICLEIAEKLQERLQKEYKKVVMTRTTDTNVYLNERARIANRENADIFISIHQNALENDNVTNGIETWHNPVKDTESKVLAEIIQENIIQSTNAKDLGIKESEKLIVIKNTQMPSCIIETGFLSCQKERQNLLNSVYQDKIVDGIYNGIKAYFENT